MESAVPARRDNAGDVVPETGVEVVGIPRDDTETLSDSRCQRSAVEIAAWELDFGIHLKTARRYYQRLDELDARGAQKAVDAVINRVLQWQATVPKEIIAGICKKGREDA